MLQFITHTNDRYNYIESALQALDGGCKWIQLRMKDKGCGRVSVSCMQTVRGYIGP